jgi:hypothetical protein
MRKPTIWEALAMKLGREPTNAEAIAEVKRILAEPIEPKHRDNGMALWKRPGKAIRR